MPVDLEVFGAVRFSARMPFFGHEGVEGARTMRERQKEVKMWRIARLKLKNPEVTNVREPAAEGFQEGVEVLLYGPSIRGGVVIGHCKLTYQLRERI